MTFALRAGAGPVVRIFTGAIAIAVLLAMLALPAAADSGPVRLSSPSVSPRGGTTATTFTFTVTYRHRRGSVPDRVRVVVGGTAHRMVASGSDHWKRGVTFTVTTTLPAGNHTVRFVAVDPAGNEATIPDGKVSVARPRSSPKPPATSAPRQTAAPSPSKTATPPAAPANPAVEPSPSPGPAAPDTGDTQLEPSTGGTGGSGGSGPTRGSGPTPGDGGPGEATAVLPAGWGDLTRYLEALGLDPAGSSFFQLVPVMIWTTGGVAMAMAFGFFGKRRRDGEPPEPDEVLSANAARGTGEAATAELVPDGAAPQTPFDLEMSMPRWRRPSLLQARKADPLRTGVERPRLSFDNAAVAPYDGYQRRLIRYLVVQLLDTPDEFRGAEIGALAQGDEVQLIEQSGTYWRVLCPDGSHGWIHRMTLGDVVGEAPAPTARDTWATTSVASDDVDEDVLDAFMTARGRA